MSHELLQSCIRERDRGADFPTIWRTVLRPNSLVIGLPGHEVVDGEACIVVNLTTGRQLLVRAHGFSLR